MRVRNVSKYAWAEFVQAANAGTSFHHGAAVLDAVPHGGGGVGATIGTARSSSPSVSPRPSGATARGGRVTPAERGPPPANPFQATFLNRVCLFDIDDKHKAKLQRWWVATRCWSWGYEKQRRTDESIAHQEREAMEAEEVKRVAAAGEEKAAAAAAEAAAAAAAEEEEVAALKGKGHHGPPAAAASGRGRLSTQRSIQQPGGGTEVGRRGGLSLARNALGSGASALGRRWQRRHAFGATGENADGELSQQEHRGLHRTHTAPPTAGAGEPTRGSVATLAAEGKGLRSVASVSVGLVTSADGRGALGATAAAEGGPAADGQQAEQADSTAVPEAACSKIEAPQPVDWERDVWSQCRLHRVSTSPLLLPMASSTLRGFSAKDSTRDDGDPGEEASLIVEANRSPNDVSHFSGPYGGGYTEGDGRWGLGKWETSRGSFGRGTPGGSGAIGTVSENDPVTSPKDWEASSHNSPGMTQYSGSVAEGASVRLGRADSSAACVSSRDRHRAQSDFEDIEVLRSRSATSSGPGRDSLDSNEPDDRWDPASTTSASVQPARGGAAGDSSKGVGSSFTLDWELDGAGGGERQTRSVSLAGLGLTGSGWDADPSGTSFSTLRRKSSAAENSLPEAAATPGSAAMSTPRGRGTTVGAEDAAVKAEEAERAAALARQFVQAYSSYLVEYLGFTLMGGPTNGVPGAQTGAIAGTRDSDDTPRIRPVYAGQTATPPSSHVLGPPGWGGEGPAHDGGKAEGRADEHFCSPATRGSGGELLAHALLRLPFELTNTVALVEVSVMVAPATSVAAAAAAATEPMQASVKFWTVDITEPSGGWEGDGPIGGSVEGQSPSRSWWADLPTLTSFKWNVDPDNPTFYGYDLPEDLPHDMYRVIHKLRFRNSVEDFVVGQVNLVEKERNSAWSCLWCKRLGHSISCSSLSRSCVSVY